MHIHCSATRARIEKFDLRLSKIRRRAREQYSLGLIFNDPLTASIRIVTIQLTAVKEKLESIGSHSDLPNALEVRVPIQGVIGKQTCGLSTTKPQRSKIFTAAVRKCPLPCANMGTST